MKYFKHRVVFFISFLVLFIAGIIAVIARGGGKAGYETYASNVLTACKTASYRPACYDKEIPKLMKRLSMEETLEVTKIVQEQDPAYAFCHVLGHELSAQETKKDPQKWKEVITRCPSGVCSNGCIHGAFQERFRTESLSAEQLETVKPELFDVCEPRGSWRPTPLEQASCYHAFGHLLMYVTNANLHTSVTLCDEIAYRGPDHDFLQVCYDGVFMQIFQPLEPEDKALVLGKQPQKEETVSYCAPFAARPRASCLNESWPLFWFELQKPEGLVQFCNRQDSQFEEFCYNGLIYVLAVQQNLDLAKMKAYCLGLPAKFQGRCFASVASRLIEVDWGNSKKAVLWCESVSANDQTGACFAELVQYSNFVFRSGSAELLALCNDLPAPWRQQCMEKERAPASP